MKRIIMLGALVLLVAALWSAGWLYAANEVRTQISLAGQNDGLTAPRLTCDGVNVGGYPFRLDVTCTGATVVSGDLTATLAEARASVQVDNPFHAQIFAKSPLNFKDAFTGSQSRVDWADLRGSARLDNWRIARVSFEAATLAWVDTLATETPIANASHAAVHLLDIPEQHDATAGLAALAGYAELNSVAVPALAIAAGEARVEVEISGLPDNIARFGEPEPLRRWQAMGGRLKLVNVQGTDGDNFVNLTGELGLDATGRPEGSTQIASRGVVEQFEAFIPENLRGLMLGQSAADGSRTQTVTITNGMIFAGLLPAGTVLPLY